MKAKTQDELLDEMEQLRNQLDRQQHDLDALRQREQGYRRLLGQLSDSAFTVDQEEVDQGEEAVAGAHVEMLSAGAPTIDVASVLASEQMPAAAGDAPVTLSLPGEAERPGWTVTMVPVEEAPEGAPHWLGAARRSARQAVGPGSRALLRQVFHLSPAAMIITRRRDGYVLDANDAFFRITGYEREELVGRTTLDARLWAYPDRRGALVETLRRQEVVYDYEIAIRDGAGEERTLLFSMQRVEVGGEACLLAVGNDITARKQTEQAMQEATERAEEIARFRNGILSNMTHEVRTPLTVILGFTSLLRQGVQEDYRRFVTLIERSGRRLLLTLDSVLDLAQIEAGTLEVEPQPLGVLDLVHHLAEVSRPLAEDRGLSFEMPPPPHAGLYAMADYDLLSRVLSHLIDNAIKFTKAGAVSLAVRQEHGTVYIDVKDTGIGIGEEFLRSLFEAFSQESTGLERTHQGSGLGLTVSKRLIEHIGGTLSVESAKGEGSTFTVALPAAAGGAMAA